MPHMPQDKPILLMVTSQDWGGAQAYVFGLAQEMRMRGLPVMVVAGKNSNPSESPPSTRLRACFDKRDLRTTSPLDKGGRGDFRPGGELSARCRAAGIDFIGLRWMARDINPINNLLSLFEMWRLFRRLRPRAIQLNSTMMGVIGSLAARLSRVPRVVYVVHGWVFEENLPAWRKRFYVWIEKISARWKDVIICLHPKDEELAHSLKIKPHEKIVTIPNGIDVEGFEHGLLSRETARTSLSGRGTIGTLEDVKDAVVGTVANAYPPKNLLRYLDVCQAVHKLRPDMTFVIIGDGPLREELRRKHAALKQEDYVLLAGRRLDAPRLYRAFDLFVLPSTKEGMPITLLEAMAAHVPCVATDVGAVSWMLDGAGAIVPPDDQDSLAKAILELASDDQRRQQLADKAYAQVKSRFAWERTVDEAIQSLLPS